MSIYNPFSNYQIAIPKQYSEEVKKFCKQSEPRAQGEFTPFNRQVDLWYFAFIYAVKTNIKLQHFSTNDVSNITAASILEDYHVKHMQMVYLADNQDIEKLDEAREMFNYVSALANAGIPHVLQILNDIEEGKPLYNLLDTIEEHS